MASASSGIGSFVGGSAYDPAQPHQTNTILIAAAVAVALIALIAFKR